MADIGTQPLPLVVSHKIVLSILYGLTHSAHEVVRWWDIVASCTVHRSKHLLSIVKEKPS